MTDETTQPYQRIAQDVQRQIRTGRLKPGDKLPSTREIADEYGVAIGTVQRALTELRARGAIYSHQGRGSFVQGVLEEDQLTALERKVADLLERVERIEQRSRE